jgi:hypothetical protein
MEKALKVAVILSATDKMSKVIDGAVSSSTKSLTRLSKETSALGDKAFKLGREAGALGLAVGAPLFMMAQAAEESQQATKKLEQVFKSMGETTGRSAAQAKKFSESLMMEIAVDDEQIVAVQTKLATFEKVIKNTAGTSEIFERATKAAFDLEAAGFGEGTQNAVQLGKALQDPIKGITALARSGVTFTEGEKNKIKAMVETGKHLDAQRYLMAAIEKQVGGVAKANVTDTAKIKIAWGEVMETLGSALLPALEKFTKWFTGKAIPAIQKFVDENGPLVKNIMLGAAALSAGALAVSALSFAFGGLMKVISFGTNVFNYATKAFQFMGTAIRVVSAFMMANPIIAIITGIAVAALLIYAYWDKIKAFFLRLWEGVKQIFAKTWSWIKNLFLNYTPHGLIYKNWDNITAWFRNLWDRVKVAFSAAWAWIKNLFLNYTPHGLVIKHWEKIVGFFGNLWLRVKMQFMAFVGFVMQLPKTFYKAGEAIVNSLWNGMKAKFNDMKNWFKSGLQDLRDMLPFSPAKRGPLKDIHKLKLVETIATNIKPGPMVDAMNKSLKAVKGSIAPKGGGSLALAGAGARSGGGGSPVTVNFQPTFNMGPGAGGSRQDFLKQLKEYEPELMRLIKDATARGERRKF